MWYAGKELEQGKFYTYSRYVMEQYLGRKLNSRERVIHLDGDGRNVDISNLRVVSIEESVILARNDWYGKEEITDSGIMYAKLKLAIKERSKL